MDDRSPPGPTMLTREAPRTAPSGGAAHAVAPENGRALSPRVLLLALVLIPLNCYWIVQMERVRQGPYVTSISLFANVVFILLLLYVMLSISSGICGMDFVQVLMQIIAFPFYFASSSNRWAVTLFPILPK